MPKNTIGDISDFTVQLDYSIERTEERLAKLRDILEVYYPENDVYFPAPFFLHYFTDYYNANINQSNNLSDKIPVCLALSYMAGYVLFNKEENNDNIIKEKTQNYRSRKHISLEKEIEGKGEENLPQAASPAIFKNVKPQITEQDRKNIPPLQDMNKFISALALQMEQETNAKERFRLKRILIEARQDQYAIKECYLRPIKFSPNFTSTEYVFDEDTGYFDEKGDYNEISINTIDFSNPKHIYQLLNHYSGLRQQHYDNPNSDMKYILDTLEDLIEITPFEDLFSRVLTRRIDGATYEVIAKEIKDDYGIDFSVSYFSSSFVNYIPKEIAKVYEQEYEDWYYTYAAKGDYKQCNGECKQNKLRSEKYFRKYSKSPDGLSTICKECRKRKESK